MTQNLPSSIPSLVPKSAPFSPEQRTWLNGLFAGMISLEESVTPLSNEQAAKLMPGLLDAGAPAEADDGAPWHDPAMPLPDRMKLADGKPLPRRLMAAMAQQDCSQCGYNCKDYAEALFTKKELRLNLCVPGGKDTARTLKTLYAELGAPAAASADAAPVPAPASAPGRSRDNPVTATFLSRRRLNKEGSAKETWHIEFDLADSGLDYVVGNSFGVYPANDAVLVDAVIAALEAPADFPIGGRTLREVLTDGVSLSPAPDMLFQLISYITGGDRKKKAQALAGGYDPDGDAATLDVLAALHKFPGIRPDPEAFIESLDPLQPPRLFDLLVAQAQPRPRLAHGRCGALRSRKAHAARRCLDLPRRPRFARRQDQGLCAEGPAFRAAGRSGQADHHDRTGHGAGTLPRFPAGAPGDRRAGPQLALFRPSAQRL